MSVIVILILVSAFLMVTYMGVTLLRTGFGDETMSIADEHTPTVPLTGEVVMMSHDGLHHPVDGHVTATLNRRFLASTTVAEDNTFEMEIPALVRGPVAVSLGLHGGAVSVIEADGEPLHTMVIYNPVNNFFA